MKIVIDHLTRMDKGFFCAAGIDVRTRQHVRAVTTEGRVPVAMLSRYGGPFDMARVIELAAAQPCRDAPHSEDYVFDPSGVRSIPNVAAGWFWELLCSRSCTTLREIFGRELKKAGPRSCATSEGRGSVSLGCFRPSFKPELWIRGSRDAAQIRMKMRDNGFRISVSVTDIRLYKEDHFSPDYAIVKHVAHEIRSGTEVVLGVGLTRAFAGYHWLQVNNIHLRADPTWQLG